MLWEDNGHNFKFARHWNPVEQTNCNTSVQKSLINIWRLQWLIGSLKVKLKQKTNKFIPKSEYFILVSATFKSDVLYCN